MDRDARIEAFNAITGGELSSLAEVYVGIAEDDLVAHVFPYNEDATFENVPERYHSNVALYAAALANRQGVEGQSQYSANGVTATMRESLSREFYGKIPRFAGVPR